MTHSAMSASCQFRENIAAMHPTTKLSAQSTSTRLQAIISESRATSLIMRLMRYPTAVLS